MEKNNKDKDLVCRACGFFFDWPDSQNGKCPICEDDVAVHMNDFELKNDKPTSLRDLDGKTIPVKFKVTKLNPKIDLD
jgi:hypothetical protein